MGAERTLPPGAAGIVHGAGGADAVRAAGTLPLWTRADHLPTTTAQALAAELGLPVTLLVRDDDGTVHRHLVTAAVTHRHDR